MKSGEVHCAPQECSYSGKDKRKIKMKWRGGKSALIEVTQGNEDSTIFRYFPKKVAKHQGKWIWESKDNNMKRLPYTVAQKSRLKRMVKVTEEE